jgi:hypothetical protein
MQTRASPIPPDLNGVTVYGQWVFSKQTNATWENIRIVQMAHDATTHEKNTALQTRRNRSWPAETSFNLLSTNAVDKYVKSL